MSLAVQQRIDLPEVDAVRAVTGTDAASLVP